MVVSFSVNVSLTPLCRTGTAISTTRHGIDPARCGTQDRGAEVAAQPDHAPWRVRPSPRRVAVLPGADAHLVALGVGEDPEGAGERAVDQDASCGEGCGHARLGLVVAHGDVEVDAIALWPRGVHLLEPHGGELP